MTPVLICLTAIVVYLAIIFILYRRDGKSPFVYDGPGVMQEVTELLLAVLFLFVALMIAYSIFR